MFGITRTYGLETHPNTRHSFAGWRLLNNSDQSSSPYPPWHRRILQMSQYVSRVTSGAFDSTTLITSNTLHLWTRPAMRSLWKEVRTMLPLLRAFAVKTKVM